MKQITCREQCGGMGFLVAVLALFATPASAATNYYADSFESYTNGTLLVGDGTWTAPDPEALVVEERTYTNYTGGAYPMPGAHTKVLKVQSDATNAVVSDSGGHVWIDHVINPHFWEETNNPAIPDDAQMAYYFTTNGHPVIHHANYSTAAKVWTEIPEVTIATSDWVRVTIEMNYAESDNTYYNTYFRFNIDGVAVTNEQGRTQPTDGSEPGGPWFPMLFSNGKVSAVSVSGTAYLDDFVVTDSDPFATQNWTISVSHSDGGTIVPDGDVSVTNGGSHSVIISNFLDYAISQVIVDGVNQGTPASWAFENVTTNHSIHAIFTESGMKTITATVEAGEGTIAPVGAVEVPFNGTTNFTMTPALYWSVGDVLVDDITQGQITGYTFSNVTDHHTIKVYFIADKTASGVPHWWLHDNVGATADFTEAAATNTDGDAYCNGDEYWSSTDPNDPDSYLKVAEAGTVNGTNYVVWHSACIDPELSPYIVLRSTNMASAAGWTQAGLSDARQGTNTWMEAAPPVADRAFYRIGATNVPSLP